MNDQLALMNYGGRLQECYERLLAYSEDATTHGNPEQAATMIAMATNLSAILLGIDRQLTNISDETPPDHEHDRQAGDYSDDPLAGFDIDDGGPHA